MTQTSPFFLVFLPLPSHLSVSWSPWPGPPSRYLQRSLQVGGGGGRQKMTQMNEGSGSSRGIGPPHRAADRNANIGSALSRRRPRSSATWTSRCRWVGRADMLPVLVCASSVTVHSSQDFLLWTFVRLKRETHDNLFHIFVLSDGLQVLFDTAWPLLRCQLYCSGNQTRSLFRAEKHDIYIKGKHVWSPCF